MDVLRSTMFIWPHKAGIYPICFCFPLHSASVWLCQFVAIFELLLSVEQFTNSSLNKKWPLVCKCMCIYSIIHASCQYGINAGACTVIYHTRNFNIGVFRGRLHIRRWCFWNLLHRASLAAITNIICAFLLHYYPSVCWRSILGRQAGQAVQHSTQIPFKTELKYMFWPFAVSTYKPHNACEHPHFPHTSVNIPILWMSSFDVRFIRPPINT